MFTFLFNVGLGSKVLQRVTKEITIAVATGRGVAQLADARMWVSGGSNSDIVALSTTSLILVVIPYVTSVELRFNHTSLKDQLAWT